MIDTPCLLFRPGHDPEQWVLTLPRMPTYEHLADALRPTVGGGIEHVAVLYDGERRDMFVDGDGVGKALPVNPFATAIYRAAFLLRHPEARAGALASIYGPAVLFTDRKVWF